MAAEAAVLQGQEPGGDDQDGDPRHRRRQHLWQYDERRVWRTPHPARAAEFADPDHQCRHRHVVAQRDEAAAVMEICRRVDGIPLAIELAASRMASMTAIEVRDRLDQRFRLLVGSRRGLKRHHTLRHAVA